MLSMMAKTAASSPKLGSVLTKVRSAGTKETIAVGIASPNYYRASREGVAIMAVLDRQLADGARCMQPECLKASDACLLKVCWAAWVARWMCVQLEHAKLGPYAE